MNFAHVGIYVNDIDRMRKFYTEMLDFLVTDVGDLERPDGTRTTIIFLSRNPDEHHQIILAAGRPESINFNPINQISFRADSLATLVGYYARFQAKYSEPLDPASHGNAVSFYVPDPEGNRLELYWQTPWYVSQPMKEYVDLTLPVSVISETVERQARALPGFKSHALWSAEMSERMGLAK
jgi:catechol 2,3-dioxygenase-like lactoylglutathione lyase family enzyme